jgi:hypothetical protein
MYCRGGRSLRQEKEMEKLGCQMTQISVSLEGEEDKG